MAVAALARPVAAQARPAKAAPMSRAKPQALPFGGALQLKTILGPAHDSWEREADTAAAHVVGGRPGGPHLSSLPMMSGGGVAQRACPTCGGDDDKTHRVMRKCACGSAPGEPCTCRDHHHDDHEHEHKEEKHPELQIDRRAKAATPAKPAADPLKAVESVVQSPGTPLPDPVRHDMEQGFGRSFAGVRIHDNSRAAASAEGIGAHAYTVGNHVAFNQGRYQPTTESGRFLLAHELAHTVQQTGPPATTPRISQPTDRHEAQANRAAQAVVGGSPMPGLSPGAAPVSRYSLSDFGDDLASAGDALLDVPGEVADAAGEVVDAAGNVLGGLYDIAVGIADAIGGAVSLDGTTIVISIPEFDPCPEIEFDMQLSDLGLDPTLYFPVVAGALGIGIVDVIGVLGVEANIDPGFGFRLDGCNFGPAEIRIDPLSLSPSVSVSGAMSVTGASMISLGGDLGGTADMMAVIAWPDPPFVLVVPLIGLSVGGTLQGMMQIGGTFSGAISATMGLGGISAANALQADIGVRTDLAYGLYGSLSILGTELCRVGWPLDESHLEAAARFTLDSSISVGTGGLSFSLGVTASPMATNPLDDLGFAFDASRLEDDCKLCEFLTQLHLMPGQNGHNWANPAYQKKLPRFGGPEHGIVARDPGLVSEAKCRGTCGVDCPANNCDPEADLVVCQNVGDRHEWHTYKNYATCGAAQGCLDHDACYDDAAEMPIWGFGGYMIGPMYRACDLEALCGYSFQQAVTWARGGGPYTSRLRYADSHDVQPGCLGPCPQNEAAPGEVEVQKTCLDDRELWAGVQVGDTWGKEFFNQRLFEGFVEVPYIVGVHYGVDASARIDADAGAQLGPINLQNACMIYDPNTMTYRGTADLSLFANLRGSARISASLEGFLSDFLCLLNWVTLRGTLSAGVTVQLPTDLTVGVEIYCEHGNLHILPKAGLQTCLDIFGEIRAGLDVFLLSYNVYSQEWPLIEKQIQKCWQMQVTFDPFVVGEMPNFHLLSDLLDLNTLLGSLFEPAAVRNLDHKPARSPLPAAPKLLFPCLNDDPPDEPDKPDATCPTKATGDDGLAHLTPDQRKPVWGPSRTVSIPGSGGGSASVATTMEAAFLVKGISGGSDKTSSVQKGIYQHPGLPTLGCFDKKKKGEPPRKIGDQQYIKGHLLNAEIGGPAEEKNLFPITAQANADHKTEVEQGGVDVVGRVNRNELTYYKVTVQNPSAPAEIMTSAGTGTDFYQINATYMCEIADYQLCTDNTFKRNPSRFVPITSQFAFFPSGGKPFDEITDGANCKR